jgi:hypothetical protein
VSVPAFLAGPKIVFRVTPALVLPGSPGQPVSPRRPTCHTDESPALFLEELLDDFLDIAMLGVDGVVEMAHVFV